MPNIDFYAVGSDFDAVLKYVFEQSGCRMFESYSPFGEELAEFKSIGDLAARHPIGICRGTAESVFLHLVPPSGVNLFTVERVDLSPEACDGHTFRYKISGWGLIQLHLGGRGPHGVVSSHGNHNSKSRAHLWESTITELRPADMWDWSEIARISSALNRFIRTKLAVYKLGSRPVLRDAAAAFDSGEFPVVTTDKALLEQRKNGNVSAAPP